MAVNDRDGIGLLIRIFLPARVNDRSCESASHRLEMAQLNAISSISTYI